jgi:hypothetical protein
MLIGIGLFGLVAANIAAFFVTGHEDDQTALVLDEIRGLRLQLDELQHSLQPDRTSENARSPS